MAGEAEHGAHKPSEYIGHHLSNLVHHIDEGNDFMSLNVDTISVSIILGLFGFGFIWWVVRGATSGVPGKRQAFVELALEFVDGQVKSMFHGETHAFVAPLALTIGV